MRIFSYGLGAGLLVLTSMMIGCGGPGTTGTTGTGGSDTTTTTTTTGTTGTGGATTTTGTTGTGGGTTAGTTTGTGGAGGGPMPNSGDCNTNADCPGTKCVEVTPGGFRVCFKPIAEITTCAGGLGGCCKTSDCPSGQMCFPPFYYCGGIVGPQNKCLADSCQGDADCKGGGSQICVAAGVLGRPVNTCMAVGCEHDSDCGAAPGGKCQPVDSPCCGEIEALYCVYDGSGCRHKSDCPNGYCANDGQKSFCSGGSPACPI